MPSVFVRTPSGDDKGALTLPESHFGQQPNVPLMHQVVTAQLAKRRAGTQSTKTRAEVSGGGKKPFKQKGTGNARQGSIRAPHFSGGGVALGPKPRKYDQKTPKKMIKAALRSALSDRAADSKVVVVDDWGFSAPKTKDDKAALTKLGIAGKTLVVVDVNDNNTIRSFLNIPEVQLIERGELNAYDVLCNDWVVFTKATLPSSDSVATKPADAAVGAVVEIEVEAEAPAKKAPAKKSTLIAPALADLKAGAEGSASDEAQAAREGSEADDEPATSMDEPTTSAADLPVGAVAPLEDGSAPEGYEIKGNADSGLYHVPGSAFYTRTVAEFWFKTAEDAEAAGFQLPPSQRPDAADEESK